jgi:hypothetical protein
MTMLQSAFVDAGLMSGWYASFVNGVEQRVMEVTYDAAKTYGKTYYMFTFNGSQLNVATSTGWNTTTNVPRGPNGTAGTQYLDYGDTVTNGLSSYSTALLASLNPSSSISITRYTSSGRSFFVLRASTTNYISFTIDPPGTSFRSWVNFDFHYHSGFFRSGTENTRRFQFNQATRTRRDALVGGYINVSTSPTPYGSAVPTNAYTFGNNTPVAGYTISGLPGTVGLLLPNWSPISNPQAPSTYNPVFTGLRISAAHAADLPADFGATIIKASNTVTIGDTATVTAGAEEYEVLDVINIGTTTGTMAANPAFLARIVG